MTEFIRDTCETLGVDLKIIKPKEGIIEYHKRMGVPADIVPVWSSMEASILVKDRPLINSSLRCCWDMRWNPMREFVAQYRPTFVIRGSKKIDKAVGVPNGHAEDGITYISPLWDMSDADVYGYLKSIKVELPDHYEMVQDSLDCYLCSAFLSFDTSIEKIEFTKTRYPDLWPSLRDNLRIVKDSLASEAAAVSAALAVIA